MSPVPAAAATATCVLGEQVALLGNVYGGICHEQMREEEGEREEQRDK